MSEKKKPLFQRCGSVSHVHTVCGVRPDENGDIDLSKAGIGSGSVELPAGYPYIDRHEKTVIPYFPLYTSVTRWSAPVGTNEDLSLLVDKKLAVFDGVEWSEYDGVTVTELDDGTTQYELTNYDTYVGEYDGVRTKFQIKQTSKRWYLNLENEKGQPLAVYVISDESVYHPIVANYLPDGTPGNMERLDLVAIPDEKNENNVVSSEENFLFRPITWYYCGEQTLPVGQTGDKYKAIVMGTEYELVAAVSTKGNFVYLNDVDDEIRVVSLISGETSALYKDQTHYFTKPGTYMLWDKEVRIYHAEERLPTLTSPNGTQYKLSVADDGTLSAVAVE